jgi:hypothetical protein
MTFLMVAAVKTSNLTEIYNWRKRTWHFLQEAEGRSSRHEFLSVCEGGRAGEGAK